MGFTHRFIARPLLLSILLLSILPAPVRGQGQQDDDVIRVNTELVQTEVTVVDKQGRFVEGLQREQFELRVDGQPQPISFFERVTAGSAREASLGLRDGSQPEASAEAAPDDSYRGRVIVFFIDDLHLSLQSVGRTREVLENFIAKEMKPGDRVAIASASGQIGFLQQFTNNKTVLRRAVGRLNHHPYNVRGYGTGSTPMSEFMALTIESKSDPNVFGFFVQECMKQSSMPKRDPRALMAIRLSCETQVKNSARAVLTQATEVISNTYSSLEMLMRSSQRLPGRKLVFFVSDGFLRDTGARSSSSMDKLQSITDAALRAGVVIYTIDARGLFSGLTEASSGMSADPTGLLSNTVSREATAYQDALNALAADTGGRALRNQASFDGFVEKVLDETSNYYLLAWRPQSEAQKNEKFRRVEVSVAGRPDLTVRLPRGYIGGAKALVAAEASEEKSSGGKQPKPPETVIKTALEDSFTRDSLPTLLSLSFLNTPNNGTILTSSMQVASRALDYGAEGTEQATVDLAGVILTDKGKVAVSFQNRLGVKPFAAAAERADATGVIYNHRAPLEPGIYQVRVVARDDRSGRVGSAMEWIEIPDLSARRLTLSSLLLGGQLIEAAGGKAETSQPQVQFSVDHRFPRGSNLSFWVFAYNAVRSSNGEPSLTARLEVWRGDRMVFSAPARPIPTKGLTDVARIPYGGELTLKSLGAGRYELRLFVTDEVAKTSATQSIEFQID